MPNEEPATYDPERFAQLRELINTAVQTLPTKEAGQLVIDAARAMVERRSPLTPHGTKLLRLVTTDAALCIVIGEGRAGRVVNTAYAAIVDGFAEG